jgi:hypothetical protein
MLLMPGNSLLGISPSKSMPSETFLLYTRVQFNPEFMKQTEQIKVNSGVLSYHLKSALPVHIMLCYCAQTIIFFC